MEADSRPPPHTVYEFGDFRLDATRGLLFAKDSQDPLPVPPKVNAALLLFIERRRELLTKNELLAHLWPGRVVEENSLTQLISALRHVLGEVPGENRYVATVPGRGYRFVADVVLEEDAGQLPREISPIAGTRSRRTALIGLAAGIAAILLAYGWYTQWRPAGDTPPVPPAAAELPARTIAVLPFENLSTDDANEYIAFGIAESVLHRLANQAELTVIARSSSFAFGDRAADARDIGRTLNARYLVEGSLQYSGPQLRVTAQLIDASTGSHVWSLRFDRTLADIFSVEDEIAKSVSDALQVSLGQHDHPYARYGIEAYLAFLYGRELVATRKIDKSERAIESFSRAIEIAPDFAAAHVALADAYMQVRYLQVQGPGRPSPYGHLRDRSSLEAGGREAEPLLVRALQLDDSLGEAYVLRADLKVIAEDLEGAEADYRKGLALSPNYGIGHEHYALLLEDTRRMDEAHAEIDKALVVDPLAPQNFYLKGFLYGVETQEGTTLGERAEGYFQKALEIDPDFHPALMRIGSIRWYQGRFAEAIQLGERAVAIDRRADWLRSYLVEFYLELGDVDAAHNVLAEQPNPVQPEQRLTLCWYERALVPAVEWVRAKIARQSRDHDVEAYVIRDAALASGELEAGRQELAGWWDGDDPYAQVAGAQLSLELGDRAEAERLAQKLTDLSEYRLAYPRAAALTLLGQQDAALSLLEESFELGYRRRWWYAFERDPAFESLRSDARFQALAVRAREHAEAERERVEQMRKQGQVPTRAASAETGDDLCRANPSAALLSH